MRNTRKTRKMTNNKKDIIAKLKKIGERLEKTIKENDNPEITMPVRTLTNAYFDEKDKLIRLGDKRQSRTFFNVFRGFAAERPSFKSDPADELT